MASPKGRTGAAKLSIYGFEHSFRLPFLQQQHWFFFSSPPMTLDSLELHSLLLRTNSYIYYQNVVWLSTWYKLYFSSRIEKEFYFNIFFLLSLLSHQKKKNLLYENNREPPRNDIESKSPPRIGPPRTALQRSATLPANPKLAKRVPFRVRSPSTDQVNCLTGSVLTSLNHLF